MNSRHPAAPFLRQSPSKTTSHRGDYSFGHLPPTTTIPGKLLRHSRSLIIVELFSSPILSPRDFTFHPFFLHIRNYPKVCPDSLNLLNAGDSFTGIPSLSSCYLFFTDQGLDCYVLESSRVFFVIFQSFLYFKPVNFYIS
jgi:hypothetical protein